MKLMKRAAAMSLALLLTAQPVMAAQETPKTPKETGTLEEAEKEILATGSDATKSNAQKLPEKKKEAPKDEVCFNTGSFSVSVVSEEDMDNGFGDVTFEEDGSYTIQISEENPFFPYEVQFSCGETTTTEWFMDPDDSVTVNGHDFYVSAYFDGTAVTQMSLEIAGDTVVVYPEEKEFTDGDGAMPLSLLPLEERYLTLDLTGYTPAELTMVSVDSVFAGEKELAETDKVMWTRNYDDDYKINMSGDCLDLSLYTCSNSRNEWEMIVGDDDQLAASNIRYRIIVETTESEKWLVPELYRQNDKGERVEVPILKDTSRYYDYSYENRYLRFQISENAMEDSREAYVGLKINEEIFSDLRFDYLKIYEGEYRNPEAAEESGKDITSKVYNQDMTKENSGLFIESYTSKYVTMVAYDANGKAVGCLPFFLEFIMRGNFVRIGGLYSGTGDERVSVLRSTNSTDQDNIYQYTLGLQKELKADEKYYLVSEFESGGAAAPEQVSGAYVGFYSTMMEAEKAGAVNIKEALFDSSETGGYAADYSEGVDFTVFIGEDHSKGQRIWKFRIKTEEYKPVLSDSTYLNFTGLYHADREYVHGYTMDVSEDSYAEDNFLTMVVAPEADLTNMAPVFSVSSEAKVYTAGSNTPEISGESYHDFSKGPIQYTVVAENGKDSKNYWLNIVKPAEGKGQLYVTSLADENVETQIDSESGTISSTREMLLDGRYGYYHDILVTNIGTDAIENLKAEIISDEVEMDPYWSLSGDYELKGFDLSKDFSYGSDQWNQAKIRIVPKEGMDDGRDIQGTLTLTSGDAVLMVLTLTGTVGDPSIITKEIPAAVKYVPYGAVIQNSNKYSWNTVTYRKTSGKLPKGMTVKSNGELYGVPTEAGEFTFTVQMKNSYSEFKNSERTFTLLVEENTNENVESATDTGYELIQRVQDVSLNSTASQTLVSTGVYGEFVDIFLDGVKLVEGVDYTSESGSTRITIRSQTLKASNTPGTHTLGVEFRTKGGEKEDTLKRAAQNYEVTKRSSGGSSGGGGGGSSASRTGTVSVMTQDPKKGYIHLANGIVTGEGAGYSHWEQDQKGWKFIYADNTIASGYRKLQEDQTEAEQVLWEKINGSWYAFGSDGYLRSGWIFDYERSSWYFTAVENGMRSGWYTDIQDGYTYYLEPGEGKLAVGWKNIDGSWYYFNNMIAPPTWELDPNTGNWYYNVKSESRPFGSLFRSSETPDGYFVDENGVWVPETAERKSISN